MFKCSFWKPFLVNPGFCLTRTRVEVDLEGGHIPQGPKKDFGAKDRVTIIDHRWARISSHGHNFFPRR